MPTYDGSGQVVHLSVIDFYNECTEGLWCGYRYWMAITPFPYGNDKYEKSKHLGK